VGGECHFRLVLLKFRGCLWMRCYMRYNDVFASEVFGNDVYVNDVFV
jgi:hypothetical protein